MKGGSYLMTVKQTKKRLMITLTDEQIAYLENQSQKTGVSKSSVIALALQEKMEQKGQTKA